MANYIKIPLSLNPGRPMLTGTGSLTTSITTNSTDATNQVATATAFTTDGLGTSGVVDLTIAGNTVTVASCATAGDGYKAGDTLTFNKSVIGGTTDVVITLVAADLAAFEGSDTNPYQMIPVDNIACVEPVSATSCKLVTNLWDGTDTKEWTVTVSNAPASTKEQLCADLAEAINEASQNENEQPEVKLFNLATVEDVDLS